MNPACIEYCLTKDERLEFEKNGFFAVENALPAQMIDELIAAVDRFDADYRTTSGSADKKITQVPGVIEPRRPPEGLLGPHDRLNLLDVVGKDEAFLQLLDWPRTFPKVWGILGWNIQLYHSHMTVTPPAAPGEAEIKKRLPWHQDSGRLNIELEGDPRPRVSLKIGFFLTDTTQEGCGNFYIIPGSHLKNELVFAGEDAVEPEGAVPLCVAPGTAVFFDRRLWHSASPNFSDITRKVLFYGYSYRWLRPRDDMSVSAFIDRCDPVRRQLLGADTGGFSYTSPRDEDVPLKVWLREHLGDEALAR